MIPNVFFFLAPASFFFAVYNTYCIFIFRCGSLKKNPEMKIFSKQKYFFSHPRLDWCMLTGFLFATKDHMPRNTMTGSSSADTP
jgi:hypothetical protein